MVDQRTYYIDGECVGDEPEPDFGLLTMYVSVDDKWELGKRVGLAIAAENDFSEPYLRTLPIEIRAQEAQAEAQERALVALYEFHMYDGMYTCKRCHAMSPVGGWDDEYSCAVVAPWPQVKAWMEQHADEHRRREIRRIAELQNIR